MGKVFLPDRLGTQRGTLPWLEAAQPGGQLQPRDPGGPARGQQKARILTRSVP